MIANALLSTTFSYIYILNDCMAMSLISLHETLKETLEMAKNSGNVQLQKILILLPQKRFP